MLKKLTILTAALLCLNSFAVGRFAGLNLTQQQELVTVDGDVVKVKNGRINGSRSCNFKVRYFCESINGESCEGSFIDFNLDFTKGVKVKQHIQFAINFELDQSKGLSLELLNEDGSVEALGNVETLRISPIDNRREIFKEYMNSSRFCFGRN